MEKQKIKSLFLSLPNDTIGEIVQFLGNGKDIYSLVLTSKTLCDFFHEDRYKYCCFNTIFKMNSPITSPILKFTRKIRCSCEITNDAFVHFKGIHTLIMSGCHEITNDALVHLEGIHTLDMKLFWNN